MIIGVPTELMIIKKTSTQNRYIKSRGVMYDADDRLLIRLALPSICLFRSSVILKFMNGTYEMK